MGCGIAGAAGGRPRPSGLAKIVGSGLFLNDSLLRFARNDTLLLHNMYISWSSRIFYGWDVVVKRLVFLHEPPIDILGVFHVLRIPGCDVIKIEIGVFGDQVLGFGFQGSAGMRFKTFK